MHEPSKTEFEELNEPVQLQIYQQKYLMYRHFDGLRWKEPTLVFASAGVIREFSDRAGPVRPRLLIVISAFAFACTWLLLIRLR